ncbi:MAG: calcium-binding protein, partial [Planktothrix sp.]
MVTALGVGPQFYDQDVGFAPKPDTILGEGGNDTIFSSTLGGSLIDGGTDNDILQSRGPGDTIIGNAGNDSIRSQ